VSPDPDARVEARLADAVERAAVVDRLTSQLSQAQDELRRAEGEVTRLRDLLAAGQDRIHRLGTRTWSRLVKFAQGTYDEDLRAERAELVAVRAGLSEATGDLEDAQRLVGDLTRRRAEFPRTALQLARALQDKEDLLRARGDWRRWPPAIRCSARCTPSALRRGSSWTGSATCYGKGRSGCGACPTRDDCPSSICSAPKPSPA